MTSGPPALQEKAGNEFRKLGCGFCFKARPLPDFYKERETSVNQMKKVWDSTYHNVDSDLSDSDP